MQLANDIFLDFSIRDFLNGEIVFTKEIESTVEQKLYAFFNDCPPTKVVHSFDSKEYGDVLNRFFIRIFSQVTYLRGKGALQK